jgi:hypothetical protein
MLDKANSSTYYAWVFGIFMGVIVSAVTDGGTIIQTIVHLSDTQITILELLGRYCKKYYGME